MPLLHSRSVEVKVPLDVNLMLVLLAAERKMKEGGVVGMNSQRVSVSFDGGKVDEKLLVDVIVQMSDEQIQSIQYANTRTRTLHEQTVTFNCMRMPRIGTAGEHYRVHIEVSAPDEPFVWGWLDTLQREVEAEIKRQKESSKTPVVQGGGRRAAVVSPQQRLLQNPWVYVVAAPFVLGLILVLIEVWLSN